MSIGDPLALSTPVVLGLAVGLAAGWAYFLGLHATIEALGSARRPGWLLLGSLALRLALLLSVLWLVVRWTGPAGLIAALIGVIAARGLLVRRLVRPRARRRDGPTTGIPTEPPNGGPRP